MMGISRRTFIVSSLLSTTQSWAGMRYPAILSCAKNGKDHLVVALNDDGRCEWTFLLPGRGHGLAVRDDMAIVVGRRPSDWALILDRASGELRSVIPPPDGMTFTGHVVCHHSLCFLGCQANQGSMGYILKIDRVGGVEAIFPSGGVEPHELVIDDKGIFVANGGRITDPDLPRVVLNPNTLVSNLSRVRIGDGKLQDVIPLPDNLSLRHLAVSRHGLAGACQWSGVPQQSPPLLWWLKGSRLMPLGPPDGVSAVSVNAYLGSVAWWGENIIATAPRGNQYWVINPSTNFARRFEQVDVCGVSVRKGRLWISSGEGMIGRPEALMDTRWTFDNHFVGA